MKDKKIPMDLAMGISQSIDGIYINGHLIAAAEDFFKVAQENAELQQQLQSYKQKEDKLREYVNTIDNWNYKKLEGRTNQINRDELLQILNEGE